MTIDRKYSPLILLSTRQDLKDLASSDLCCVVLVSDVVL